MPLSSKNHLSPVCLVQQPKEVQRVQDSCVLMWLSRMAAALPYILQASLSAVGLSQDMLMAKPCHELTLLQWIV